MAGFLLSAAISGCGSVSATPSSAEDRTDQIADDEIAPSTADATGSVQRDASAGASPSDADAGPTATVDAGASAPAQDACPADAPKALNRVRFYPAKGQAAKMVGGHFQGSNTGPTNDFVDLATIESAPTEGAFTELTFDNDQLFRYLKYYSPDGSNGSVAELEFYHDDVRLTGAAFGTASSGAADAQYQSAVDGSPATEFKGSLVDGNYVGLDVGGAFVAAAPTFIPKAGALADAAKVTIGSTTPNAQIFYTLDGSNPTSEAGTLYGEPLAIDEDRVAIKAVASADCLFDSPVSEATYTTGTATPQTQGQKSYHVGNSLTDTINPWLEPIADSTGVDHEYARWTIPGSTVKYLYGHQGEGFGTPEAAVNFDSFVKSDAPIDHMSVQPFSDPSIHLEGKAAVDMFVKAQAASPDLQPWVYAQWPPRSEWTTNALAVGASWSDPPWTPPSAAKTWQDAALNQQLFYEKFAKYVDDNLPGKPVLIVPAGTALVVLKTAIESGQVPGVRDFFASTYNDDLHLKPAGQYLVGLVFYACFYRQSPEGRATFAGTGLTEAQARIYQKIAWEAARDYPLSGVASVP